MHLISRLGRDWWLVLMGIFLLWGCSAPTVGITPTSLLDETSPAKFPEVTQTTMIGPTETIMIEPTEIMKTEADDQMITPTSTPSEKIPTLPLANVTAVHVSGTENSYQFSVEISSPDTGCEQYADWWEVVSEDGELIYRRILAHSHVSEQPFTRSGGPVEISATTIVIVRAHMHPDGYGGAVFKGSVQAGFEETQLEADFASDLERTDPLPDGCAF